MDDGRAVDIVYLDFGKAFNAISHNVLQEKMIKCRLDNWKVRWTENCLVYWTQDVFDMKSNWRPVATMYLRT